MRQKADQASASAFGQEPWAQQALAVLRRDWPAWAFLVVRYQWLAMRGKQVLISATGPDELRRALPSVPPKAFSPKPDSAVPGPTELGPVLPTLAELLATELRTEQSRLSVSLPPALPLGADAVGAHVGDAGVG